MNSPVITPAPTAGSACTPTRLIIVRRWSACSASMPILIPLNRPPAALWDEFAGDYASADGWIRLHTNAAHHRAAMERVLGQHADLDPAQSTACCAVG